MDPITIIITALTTGAAACLKDTTSVAVKDAYHGLKALIERKVAGKPALEMALTEHERKPDTWQAPLEEGLKEIGIDQDEEIIIAAQKLMKVTQPRQALMGKYNLQVTGDVQGFAQGDNQQVTMNFGNESRPK